jgi:hypothetical protein
MKKELENKLYEKYPKLFRQKDLSMQETCMNWGVCTGNGWFWIIDNLCNCIQNYIDANKKPQAEFVQIKEKFGELRIYIEGTDELIQGMVWLAEDLSYSTCEACGTIQDIVHTKGYIKTLCKSCAGK